MHCDLKKLASTISTGTGGEGLLKTPAFGFDSALIIKIILIASQPKILEYRSYESYILITFLITLKTAQIASPTNTASPPPTPFNCYF